MKPNEVYSVITQWAKNGDAESIKKYVEEKVSSTRETTEAAGLTASFIGTVYGSLKSKGIELRVRLTHLEENFAKKVMNKKAEEIDEHNLLRVCHAVLSGLAKGIEEKTKDKTPVEIATFNSMVQHIKGLQEAIAENLQEKRPFPVSIRGEERSKTFS
jgi:nitrogen regulatory protein PII